MGNYGHVAQPVHAYVLGHSEREVDRLKAQALLIDRITERFFRAAGVSAGMRVLDVGSGAGDVAFLASRIVDAEGSVMGTDRAPEAVRVARARAADRALQNVSFVEGDPAELTFDEPFDAVIGRYVLQSQKDPAAMLRRLSTKVRPGGVVVFHEIDWAGRSSRGACFGVTCARRKNVDWDTHLGQTLARLSRSDFAGASDNIVRTVLRPVA